MFGIYFFTFLLYLFLGFINSAPAAKNGCYQYGSMLVCRGRLPRKNDLDNTIETVTVAEVPQDQWLSFGEWVNIDGSIKQIEFRRVSIDKIDTGYFSAMSGQGALRKLILRPVSGDAIIDLNALHGLSSSLNQLVVIGEVQVNLSDVGRLTGLTDLELRNTITSPMPDDFLQSLPNLRSIELANTSLSSLPWYSLVNWLTEDKTRSLKLINFHLLCNCESSSLKNLPIGPISMILETLTCVSPPHFQGLLLRDIPKDQLCPETESSINLEQKTSIPLLHGGRTEGAEGVQTDVYFAISIIAAIVIVILICIIVYNVKFSSKIKARRTKKENDLTLHQSHKYCAVIVKPLADNGFNAEQSMNLALLDQDVKYCGQEV